MTDEPTLESIATEASSWFETARRATGDTDTGPREDGDEYVRTKDGRPEWVQDLVYEAHGDFLPDDWRYACIAAAVDWLAEGNDPDDAGEFADSQVDVYNAARVQWLASSIYRGGYCDDALQEFGTDGIADSGIYGLIGLGQYQEASEVFASVVGSLRERLEEVETETEDEPVQA